MRKTINKVSLAGRVYDFKMAEKVCQKQGDNFGKTFINGTLDVATDEDCLNIVQVHFTFVTEVTKKGAKNATFAALKSIIDNDKTVLTVGKDNAMMVKIDTSLDLNDFYTDRNGDEQLVSAKRNEGGFVTVVNSLPAETNRFEMDMLINNTVYVEADPEKNIEKDYLVVKGAVFNFMGAIKPVDFIVKSEGGIKYFESLDASPQNPTFTKVWGTINNETIVTRKEEESAFGEPAVKEFVKNIREWIINGTSKPDAVYEIGNAETGITLDEVKKAIADREVYLAEVKKRSDEYKASQAAAPAVAATSTEGFTF